MAVIPFRGFKGEIPRLAADGLPEGNAQLAVNVDLQHGELRGLRGNADFTSSPLGAPIVAVYTDDGSNFFAWPYDVYPVRSMVVGDLYHRLYYTSLLVDGPIIKVARTRRSFAGNPDGIQVVGTNLVGGNFQPPENSSSPPSAFAGPDIDAWVLGVPAPRAQGIADDDRLIATLVDKPGWPGAPHLELRVTYFLEDAAGQIVFQQTINNSERGVDPVTGQSIPSVYYTNDWTQRGNKIQDMLWPFGFTPRPFKYYFYQPPDATTAALSRTVSVTNTGTGNVVITYGGGTSTAPDPAAGISDGNEA